MLERYEDREYFTSLTIINELLYISVAEYYRRLGLAKGSLSLRKIMARNGYPSSIINGIKSLIEELEVKVLNENINYKEVLKTAEELKLLPSDAIIALTCRYYGTDTILTSDEDFKRIPWLKTIP